MPVWVVRVPSIEYEADNTTGWFHPSGTSNVNESPNSPVSTSVGS